jgi:hypothetical protein
MTPSVWCYFLLVFAITMKYGVICLLTLMYAPVHVMCMCAERSFYWNMEFTARTSLNIPKHLPEKIGLDSEILSIPSPRVEDGRIYPGETGFHWYANFPGNTEKVTFQYVVDVVENDDISTHGLSSRSVRRYLSDFRRRYDYH